MDPPFGVDAGDPWSPSLPWIPGGRVGFRMWLASTGSRAEVANFCFPPALPSKFADFIRISGVPLPCLEASTRRSRPGYSYADGFDISWPERPLGAVTTCVAPPPCDNSGRRVVQQPSACSCSCVGAMGLLRDPFGPAATEPIIPTCKVAQTCLAFCQRFI